MIGFERSARELELEERTAKFIREVVIPYESDPRLGRHGPSEELCADISAQLERLAEDAGAAFEAWTKSLALLQR